MIIIPGVGVIPGLEGLRRQKAAEREPVVCHADFDDGRSVYAPRAFCGPESEALSYVNVMLGNGG
jgi:hypothetical protein